MPGWGNAMELRQPIVSVMGHVDHGKTSLLDRIAESTKAPHEAGGITQHIGAIEVPLRRIEKLCHGLIRPLQFSVPGLLFIDTPGHKAFVSMRRRGGSLADLAVVVVAMNEGFMPQTREVLQILRHEKTPFIVAVNKIDLLQGYRPLPPWTPIHTGLATLPPDAQKHLDERLYLIAEELYAAGFSAERYDRVSDYARNVAMVPLSAKTGEGIPDLLALLIGLSQKFLETDLKKQGVAGEATILEGTEVRGMGSVANVVLYQGRMHVGDPIVVNGSDGPFLSRIRAMHRRAGGRSDKLQAVEEATAAAGLVISASELERALPGGLIKVVAPGVAVEKALEDLAIETHPTRSVMENGVWLKADTVGSLDALLFECQESNIPVKGLEVGAVTKREVTIMGAVKDPARRAVLAFSVPVTPEAEETAAKLEVAVHSDEVIYRLLEKYQKWEEGTRREVEAGRRKETPHPAKLRLLPGYVFRTAKPAIVGVKVLAGTIHPPCRLVSSTGEEVGTLKGFQESNRPVADATEGAEVSAAIDGAIVGRSIYEGDVLYVYLTESNVRDFKDLPLAPAERDTLEELVKIQRARTKNRFWGL